MASQHAMGQQNYHCYYHFICVAALLLVLIYIVFCSGSTLTDVVCMIIEILSLDTDLMVWCNIDGEFSSTTESL